MTEYEVIIVGAGPAGLSLGCQLGAAGIRVAVLDRQAQSTKKPRDDNRTAALLRPAVDILRDIGIDPEKLNGTAPLRHLRLIDIPANARDQLARVDFAASEIHEPYFALNIKNAALHQALLAHAGKIPHLSIIAPIDITSLTTSDTDITLTTTKGKMTTSLLIGADGKNSHVRALAGIGVNTNDYEQMAITCAIEHEKAHHDTSIEFHRPGGPFTLVPLQGNRSSVVWMENTKTAQAILALRPSAFAKRLQQETHNELGQVTPLNAPQAWPITLVTAHHLTAPRVALIAEAAHALPPSGAQGLNLSLCDTAYLSSLIINAHQTGIDVGSAAILDRYAQDRTRDIQIRARAVDGLNRVILSDQPLVRRLRRLALMEVSRIKPVRHALMRFGWVG